MLSLLRSWLQRASTPPPVIATRVEDPPVLALYFHTLWSGSLEHADEECNLMPTAERYRSG